MKSNRKSTRAIRPPEPGVISRGIPRGLEVLIKKAAVDPAFKKMLLEKRVAAAEAIGLKLTAAEEAMLAAVPLPQLEGIIAHTRVSPKLRPAFLGYAAGAMLAVLGSVTSLSDSEVAPAGGKKRPEVRTSNKRPGQAPTGNPVIEESGSWPYSLSGGGGGGGGGTGMRADIPREGYVIALITAKGSGAGIRVDRPGRSYGTLDPINSASLGIRPDRVIEAERRRRKTTPAKTGRKSGRDQPRHRVCLGLTANRPEDSNREQPAPYLITFESRTSGPKSYRSAASIRDYIKKRLPGIQNAYDSAVENNPSLGGGKIVARFTIDPLGRVAEAEIAEDTLGDGNLRRSILSRLLSWKFPAAGQTDVVVEYPFAFIAEEG